MPLSLDWEDWFQVCRPPYDGPDALDRFEDRLGIGTELGLRLCQDLGAKATWFCLADQARRHPELIRMIQADGHRIALHGLEHRRAFTLDRAAFGAWLREGRSRLEDISGEPVRGFRAPEWSLRGRAEGYWELLRESGFAYDSSRAPVAGLGGIGRPRRVHALASGLWEVPPATWQGIPLWGWPLRLAPVAWARNRLGSLQGEGAPALVLHPWELDEGQPRLEGGPMLRFIHGAGLRGFGKRLRRILAGLWLSPIETCLGLDHGCTLEGS